MNHRMPDGPKTLSEGTGWWEFLGIHRRYFRGKKKKHAPALFVTWSLHLSHKLSPSSAQVFQTPTANPSRKGSDGIIKHAKSINIRFPVLSLCQRSQQVH